MKLHEKLYQLRKEKGLTQVELAERLGGFAAISFKLGGRDYNTFDEEIERYKSVI